MVINSKDVKYTTLRLCLEAAFGATNRRAGELRSSNKSIIISCVFFIFVLITKNTSVFSYNTITTELGVVKVYPLCHMFSFRHKKFDCILLHLHFTYTSMY